MTLRELVEKLDTINLEVFGDSIVYISVMCPDCDDTIELIDHEIDVRIITNNNIELEIT